MKITVTKTVITEKEIDVRELETGEYIQEGDFVRSESKYVPTLSAGFQVATAGFYRQVVPKELEITTIKSCRILDPSETIEDGDYSSYNRGPTTEACQEMIGSLVCAWNKEYTFYRDLD